MTINRANYRVKVDLTKYLQDARRFSWIYVDCTSVSLINHVKEHISEVFAIEEPFHLLLDGKDYLPPSEDARLLRENELIAVVPGSGISDASYLTTSVDLATTHNGKTKDPLLRPTDTRTAHCNIEKSKLGPDVNENCDKTLYNSLLGNSGNDATAYHSLQGEMTPDLKPTTGLNISADNCIPSDCYDSPVHKRKRIRRKRSKNPTEVPLSLEKVDNEASYKVITGSPLPGVGKHIHFETADDVIPRVIENNGEILTSRASITAPEDKPVINLSTLLRLRQCSTPLTFSNKKAKRMNESQSSKMESSDTEKDIIKTKENGHSNGIKDTGSSCEEPPSDYEHLKPEGYSALGTLTKLNDIIAFKILRIGNEYTPEISDYIVARTINWCPKKLLYTFEILRGQMQIQSPLGKFSLPDDESNNEICDTANFNFSQLIDPRLIYRKH